MRIRQGDVLLIKTDKLPNDAKVVSKANPVLAYGEATGHHHQILSQTAQLLQADNRTFLQLEEPAQLTHQEHAMQQIPSGLYEVRRQREYSPQAVRNVAD